MGDGLFTGSSCICTILIFNQPLRSQLSLAIPERLPNQTTTQTLLLTLTLTYLVAVRYGSLATIPSWVGALCTGNGHDHQRRSGKYCVTVGTVTNLPELLAY